jgi:hypothetical protein
MSVLITILFSFISLVALGALVYPYVEKMTNNAYSREVDVPLLGPMPMLVFGLAPVCALVVFGWLITKSWILNNILAISLIVFFLTSVRLSSLMVAASLLILAFFYDIFWVFCSSAVFGKNVMVTVATGLDVPIKILVSRFSQNSSCPTCAWNSALLPPLYCLVCLSVYPPPLPPSVKYNLIRG